MVEINTSIPGARSNGDKPGMLQGKMIWIVLGLGVGAVVLLKRSLSGGSGPGTDNNLTPNALVALGSIQEQLLNVQGQESKEAVAITGLTEQVTTGFEDQENFFNLLTAQITNTSTALLARIRQAELNLGGLMSAEQEADLAQMKLDYDKLTEGLYVLMQKHPRRSDYYLDLRNQIGSKHTEPTNQYFDAIIGVDQSTLNELLNNLDDARHFLDAGSGSGAQFAVQVPTNSGQSTV